METLKNFKIYFTYETDKREIHKEFKMDENETAGETIAELVSYLKNHFPGDLKESLYKANILEHKSSKVTNINI